MIKQSLGRLDVPDELAAVLQEEGIDTLPIEAKHAFALAHLPLHHRDPFDRILVAQAQSEGLTLISEDRKIRAYDVNLLSGH